MEIEIAGEFFPTPGISMPVSLRRMKQKSTLNAYAPSMDIERFLSESPILRAGRGGCLGVG
jgi:hypothetical protein